MLYLLDQLGEQLTILNVFRYITFRTGGAMFTAALFVFLFGPRIIATLKLNKARDSRSVPMDLRTIS